MAVLFSSPTKLHEIFESYDIDKDTSQEIIEHLFLTHYLSERDELILESYGVSKDIMDTLKICMDAYVGIFFFIDGRIFAHRFYALIFDITSDFFNDPISHFDYFNTLGIDDDYGHYPRGRVIFDNTKKRFIIYMDKSLMNNNCKKTIINEYHLNNKRVIFKRDEHYTHDGL